MGLPIYDPGPWVKFWWKGVDIVSDVVKSLVTAGIVAAVAYLTWEKKKRREHVLDLEHDKNKRIQEEKLTGQFSSERSRRERLSLREEQIRRWKAEIGDLLSRFPTLEAAGTQVLYQQYSEWLKKTKLIAFGNNLEIARRWHNKDFLDYEADDLVSDLKLIGKFREELANTSLPNPDSDDFLW